MRRPSTEHNEDDLNRLTTSASVRSTDSVNSSNKKNHNDSNNNSSKNNSSNYLPNIAIEYHQQCRKRKDRQDSTSSITQDRKVVRSSSAEHVPTAVLQDPNDVIRRVSSHEDFNKKPLQEQNENDENRVTEQCSKINENALKSDVMNNQSIKDDGSDLKCSKSKLIDEMLHELDENEHRRNSERFLKTKSPSGRKSPRRPKKSSSSSANKNSSLKSDACKLNESDEDEENLPKSRPRLPWESSGDDNPIKCQRFRNENSNTSFDHIHASFSKYIKQDHDLVKFTPTIDDYDDDDFVEKKHYRNFMSIENVKTCDILQKSHSPQSGIFQTPDERIRHINKRLTSLKKKISNYEESFENNYGYRPSHADKANDKNIKNYIAEIHRLRKEKGQIKADPLAAMGYKNKFDDTEKKLVKIKDSLLDIETVSI